MDCFEEVLYEVQEEKLIQYLPFRDENQKLIFNEINPNLHMKIVELLSIAYQLLNMVEENAYVQFRRFYENTYGLDNVIGRWAFVLKKLLDYEFSEKYLISNFYSIHIEPVFTAHPTEAKRATILEQHRIIYLLLVKSENTIWTDSERKEIKEDIKLSIERLWRTGEIFLEKPDVASERRNIAYYIKNVFPDVLAKVDRNLIYSWNYLNLNSTLVEDPYRLPRITFGNWVGGDRDGYPLVTSNVTKETLIEFRNLALELYINLLNELAKKLSLSERLQNPPLFFLNRLKQMVDEAGEISKELVRRNPEEPWRQFINLMKYKLPEPIKDESYLNTTLPGYKYWNAQQFLDNLKILRESLIQVGAKRLAMLDVFLFERLVQSYGFHSVALDIRQNSKFYEQAMTQILKAAGFVDYDFASWDENKRIIFLNTELKSSRPFTLLGMKCGPEADEVISTFRIVADYIHKYGIEGIGAFIVSMTRSLSDLLVIYIFAREVGITIYTDEGLLYSCLSFVRNDSGFEKIT